MQSLLVIVTLLIVFCVESNSTFIFYLPFPQVETIGDAYMGVCGIPQPIEHHAKHVVEMAMDMLECVQNVISPVDAHPVKVGYTFKDSLALTARIALRSTECYNVRISNFTTNYNLGPQAQFAHLNQVLPT